MIFYYTGCIILGIGIIFRLFPSRHINSIYGYRSPLAEKNQEFWKYSQKISGNMSIVMGGIMLLVGIVLKKFNWTNFFILEMFALIFPIMPIFLVTEKKLKELERTSKQDVDKM